MVLTHDVEGSKGLSRVKQLVEIERKQGFRSCFNLVPEGEYRVADATREMLDRLGFEVGIHGLEHDGKLYSSKTGFARKARRINQYLKKWNCVGFRSPLMQHKLSWLHALEVEYDASTFDTDPFEPQPDGARTLFPFWVQGPNGRGYVELPYTLVQDFTLFKVLQEQSIQTWKRKVDWIAEQGGMILLNTHPDYMCFEGRPSRDEYPVSFYEELLQYLREKYDDSYWCALPREVARYYRAHIPLRSRNTRKKICMVAYTAYEADNRVRKYAETLVRRGDTVDVVAISAAHLVKRQPVIEVAGVTVYRMQHREYNERSKWIYAWRLLCFLVRSSRGITLLHKQNRYDVIHIHNMPDFLVFAAWYPKLTGAKLILDIHDLAPELFVSKFQTRLKGIYFRWLKAIERVSARFVDHVIVSNHLWHKTVMERSASEERSSVFINNVDPEMFRRRGRTRSDNRFIVLFPGSLQRHQGLDVAIHAFAEVKRNVPNAEFHIYGGSGGDMGRSLRLLVKRLNLEESVRFYEGVAPNEVVEVIANADLGVVPKRADSFGNEAYTTKIMEFMSQGVPVVVSRTKIDSFYFEEGVVHFFPSGDSEAMAKAMLDVINNRDLRESLVTRGYEYVQRNNWATKRQGYLDLIDSLSTETFDDIYPEVPVSAILQSDRNERLGTGIIVEQGTGVIIKQRASPPQ